jgi:sialidase-1
MSNRVVLQLDPGPGNRRNSEATLVTLKSGRILLAWSKFIGDDHSDFGAGVIATRYSDDGGQTWSADDRVLIRKDRRATNVMSPSFLRLQDGRIALLFLRKEGMSVCIPMICFSDNEAKSFSKPTPVTTFPAYYVVNNDRLIQLKSGRIIMPVCQCRWRLPWEPTPIAKLPGDTKTHYPKAFEPFMAAPTLIYYFFSDDGGERWLESKMSWYCCLPDGSGGEEPGMVELNGGKLWSWARTGHLGLPGYGARQWQTFSKDQGQTWSSAEPSQFISPCSPMQVKRIATGDLLAVWNDQSERFKVPRPKAISWARTPLVSAISKDEGKTWKHHLLLEKAPDHGFSYPAIHALEDAVLLSYNAGGATTRNPLDTQRVRRITHDELYA